MYVGVIGVGDRGTDRKDRVCFSVSVFLGNRKTDKSVFGCEKPKKTTEKTTFGFQFTTLIIVHTAQTPTLTKN